jgi:hypothetical protein
MTNTIRRAALSAIAGASALAIPAAIAIASSSVADAALVDLGVALTDCDANLTACPDDDYGLFEHLHDRHWRLREQIYGLVATTIDGLRVKARAAEIAFKQDPAAENEGAGSFVDLVRSINTDILALAEGVVTKA